MVLMTKYVFFFLGVGGGGGGHKMSEKANCVLVWALINLKSVELNLVLHALRVAGTSTGFCAINVVRWLGPPQIELEINCLSLIYLKRGLLQYPDCEVICNVHYLLLNFAIQTLRLICNVHYYWIFSVGCMLQAPP